MTHRLTFHRRKSHANDFRADDANEADPIAVYASLEPTGGNETERADQQQSHPKYTIRLRWGPSLAECDSSWWATRTNPTTKKLERFEFSDVRNVGERNRELEIDAVRV